MKKVTLDCGLNLYIIEKDEDQVELEQIADGMAFVLTKDGTYTYKKNKLYKSVSKLPSIGLLGKTKTFAEFKAAKLPLKMFRGIRSFFAEIFELHKSEVAILLYHNLDTKKWMWTVPKQEVSGASVSYSEDNGIVIIDDSGKMLEEVPDGFDKMGSIHSHASMSAFHSGVDDKDEYGFDGLHITIGNFNLADCTYSVRWIISGQEIKSDIKEAVCGISAGVYPKGALEQVAKKAYKSTATTTTAVTKPKNPVVAGRTVVPAANGKSPVVAHGVHTSGGNGAKKPEPEKSGIQLVK